METTIKFAKIRGDAIIPSKKDEDMGFDLYANFTEDYIYIMPHETKLIPTGIASACEKDYGLVLFERGSTGSKGMARRCGVVDSSYRGEIFVGITNTTDKMLFVSKLSDNETIMNYFKCDIIGADNMRHRTIVYPYTKAIAQALVLPVPKTKVKEISYEALCSIKSERGTGKLGSSKK